VTPHTPPPRPSHIDALEAFDAALAQGQANAASPVTPPEGPAGLCDNWREVTDVLRLLAAVRPTTPACTPPVSTGEGPAPARIGPFELVRPLGRGGFGLVFLARDPRLNRLVALKVLRPDVPLTAELWRRFVREGRAAAVLDHPNIVPVHETGEDGPVPYIASAYCPGPTLAEWLQQRLHDVPPHTAAALVAQLADAVQHAHSRGVLHRDLKPGNVLLHPVSPFISALPGFIPKLTDFGLARLADDLSADTHSGAYLGTPSYMAPEQARGWAKEVGTASDVYGLGANLYELLTGRPPFRGATDADTLRQVVADDPLPPRRERFDVPPDLEAVCLKCPEKDPTRRYASAAALADDLRRFLDGRPTAARPLRPLGRARRWAARRPDLAGLSALALTAVLAAVVGAGWLSIRLAISRSETHAAGQLAATQEFFALLERVRQRRSEPSVGWTRDSLADLRRLAALPPAAEHLPELRSEAASALGGVDLRRVATLGDGFDVYDVAYSPDGRWLALGGWGPIDGRGRVRLVDPADGRVERELTFAVDTAATAHLGKPDGCRDLVFSPDGRWLVAASRFGGLHRWDLRRTTRRAASWRCHAEMTPRLAFGVARPVLFAGVNGELRCWDVADRWRELRRWEGAGSVSVDPISGRVAVVIGDKLHVLDGRTLQPSVVREGYPGQVGFSPDGQTLAVWPRHRLLLAEAAGGEILRSLVAPVSGRFNTDQITDVAFSPDGALLATASEWSRHVNLWDVSGGRLVADIVAGDGGSVRIAFHPDGHTLAVAANHRADLYEVTGPRVQAAVALQPHPVRGADLTPDGRALVCLANPDNAPHVWLANRWHVGGAVRARQYFQDIFPYRGAHPLVAVPPAGRGFVATASVGPNGEGLVHAWPPLAETCEERHLVDLRALSFGPDGRLWVATEYELWAFGLPGWRETARWSDASDDTRSTRALYSVAAGADAVLAGRRNGQVLRFDPAGRLHDTWSVGDAPMTAMDLDEPSGLAVAGDERGRVWVLRVPSGEVAVQLTTAHRDGVDAAALSPGGRLVATGGRDRAVRLWRPDGTPVLTLRMAGPVAMLAFTPDGHELYVLVSGERGVRRWHLGRLADGLRTAGIDPGID
jgi:WD40 repeat protein